MDMELIEKLAGVSHGTYIKNPESTYLRYKRNIGVNCIDQFIPENPLSMMVEGYGKATKRGIKYLSVENHNPQ